MLSEEEKKAIELLEYIKNNSWTTKYIMCSDSKNADILLKLITKLQKENEEKNRKIEKYLDIISKKIIDTLKDELLQLKNKELDFKDKQIDLMAELVYKRFKPELLLEYGFESKEQFKQYFAELVRKE